MDSDEHIQNQIDEIDSQITYIENNKQEYIDEQISNIETDLEKVTERHSENYENVDETVWEHLQDIKYDWNNNSDTLVNEELTQLKNTKEKLESQL